MIKKIALPLKKNKLCSHFDQCSEFAIFTIDDMQKRRRDLLHTHPQPGLFPYYLAKKGVTDIITRGIDSKAVSKLHQFKINVFVGVNSFDPEILMNEFLNGTLETNGALVND